jgi:Predicted small metal-binding protein
MKKFECGSVVPGCEWHTRADSEAEIVARMVDHLRETHGETIVREGMIERIKSCIVEDKAEKDAA